MSRLIRATNHRKSPGPGASGSFLSPAVTSLSGSLRRPRVRGRTGTNRKLPHDPRILANQVIDALRQHARELSPLLLGEHDESLEDPSTTGHGTLALLDGQALAELSPADWQDPALAAAIAKLSPMQRSVIMFWAWRQPPPTDTEIGGEFGISTSAAKTHRNRALDRLRTMLDFSRLDSRDMGEEIK
jgi:hypothetical protein